jgi:hypothetical protein
MARLQDYDHWLLLVWLLISGLIVFGFIVTWNENLLYALLEGDKSRISLLIGLIYFLGTLHCARRTAYLAVESDLVQQIDRAVGENTVPVQIDGDTVRIMQHTLSSDSILGGHLVALSGTAAERKARPQDSERSTLVDVLVSQAKGSHDIGWFVVDILLKLGLIGTIVGFILMLSSVADTASLDVNTMQKVLKQMSAGMGTALFTTLAGLTGSILLGLQYLVLDKGADLLIERILRLSESRLLLP